MKKNALAKALESMQKYPLVLHSGRECAILDGFGSGICGMLDKQLTLYRDENPNCRLTEREVDVKEKTILEEVKSILGEKRNEQKAKEKIWELPDNLNDTLEALYQKYDNLDDEFDQLVGGMKDEDTATERVAVNDFMPARVVVPGGCFDIVLLVDTQETAG